MNKSLNMHSKVFETDDNIRFRLINPAEIENLTDEAFDHLMELKSSYSISEESFEEVLADISSIFGTLDLESLKNLLDYRGYGERIIN